MNVVFVFPVVIFVGFCPIKLRVIPPPPLPPRITRNSQIKNKALTKIGNHLATPSHIVSLLFIETVAPFLESFSNNSGLYVIVARYGVPSFIVPTATLSLPISIVFISPARRKTSENDNSTGAFTVVATAFSDASPGITTFFIGLFVIPPTNTTRKTNAINKITKITK